MLSLFWLSLLALSNLVAAAPTESTLSRRDKVLGYIAFVPEKRNPKSSEQQYLSYSPESGDYTFTSSVSQAQVVYLDPDPYTPSSSRISQLNLVLVDHPTDYKYLGIALDKYDSLKPGHSGHGPVVATAYSEPNSLPTAIGTSYKSPVADILGAPSSASSLWHHDIQTGLLTATWLNADTTKTVPKFVATFKTLFAVGDVEAFKGTLHEREKITVGVLVFVPMY